jgi:hypothetical protein
MHVNVTGKDIKFVICVDLSLSLAISAAASHYHIQNIKYGTTHNTSATSFLIAT